MTVNIQAIMFALALAHVFIGLALRTSKEVSLMSMYMFTTVLGIWWIWADSGYKLDTLSVPSLLAIAIVSAVASFVGLNLRNKGTKETRKRIYRALIVLGSVTLSICMIVSIWGNIREFGMNVFLYEGSTVLRDVFWIVGGVLGFIVGMILNMKAYNSRRKTLWQVSLVLLVLSGLALAGLAYTHMEYNYFS